jgi:hypothetical protein
MTTKSSADGIEHDVTRQLEKMGVALEENTAESAVEEMALEAVPPVEPLGVDTVEPLHTDRDIAVRCLDEKVEVIRHQAIGVASPIVSLDHVLEDLLEPEPIPQIGENVGFADAA